MGEARGERSRRLGSYALVSGRPMGAMSAPGEDDDWKDVG